MREFDLQPQNILKDGGVNFIKLIENGRKQSSKSGLTRSVPFVSVEMVVSIATNLIRFWGDSNVSVVDEGTSLGVY